jgi:hypothetical protein
LIEITSSEFKDSVYFSNCLFSCSPNFGGTKFNKSAYFDSAKFSKSAFFGAAKFGQIQVHERITRELLMQIKELAGEMGFEVLHGIVDCLWVVGEPISKFKEVVEREARILTAVDSYDWITFCI